MKISNRRLAAAGLCDELGPEDGIDPRYTARGDNIKASDRKRQQLCKEAQRLLALVLAGDMGNPLLNGLQVLSVTGDGQQLLVSVAHDAAPAEAVLAALAQVQGQLRTELARSLHRKRVPALRFQYQQQGG